jgi:hypothetical protein
VDLEAEQEEINSDPDRVTKYKDGRGKIAQAIIQEYDLNRLPKNCDVMKSITAWEKSCKEAKHV